MRSAHQIVTTTAATEMAKHVTVFTATNIATGMAMSMPRVVTRGDQVDARPEHGEPTEQAGHGGPVGNPSSIGQKSCASRPMTGRPMSAEPEEHDREHDRRGHRLHEVREGAAADQTHQRAHGETHRREHEDGRDAVPLNTLRRIDP